LATDIALVFQRIGHIGGILNAVRSHFGSTVPTKVNTLVSDYTADPALIDSLYSSLSSYQKSPQSFLSYLTSIANGVIIDGVNVANNLPDRSVASGLTRLISDMRGAGSSVSRCTVAGSVAAVGTPTGNPVFVTSLKTKTGYSLDNVFAEPIAITCTGDAQSGGATQFRESFTANGTPFEPALSPLYPKGSACVASFACVDASTPSSSLGGRNLLSNSNFEKFTTPNVPDGWTVPVGVVGTTVKKGTVAYDGTGSLNFVGNGSENTTVHQALTSLKPFNQYAVNLWVRVDAVPSTGVLEVALISGGSSITQDNLSVNNSFTVTLTSLTSGVYVNFSGVFRTQRVLPASLGLRLKLTTALSNTVNLYVDRLALAEMPSLYQQGPYLSAFSGSIPSILSDSYTLTVGNDYNGKFQGLFEELFGMRGLQLLLPTSGTPTISDSLIT
jgi:hypothetical protein